MSKFHQWATNSANAEVTKRGVVDDTDCLLPVETGWGDDELKYIEGKKTVAIEATKNQAVLRGENRIRTCEPVLPVTRFPGVPLQPLEHLSFSQCGCKGTKKSVKRKGKEEKFHSEVKNSAHSTVCLLTDDLFTDIESRCQPCDDVADEGGLVALAAQGDGSHVGGIRLQNDAV